MAKRALRVVKNLGRIPAVAVCTVCGKTFEAPLGALGSIEDAEASLQQQFYGHKCDRKDVSPPGGRILKESIMYFWARRAARAEVHATTTRALGHPSEGTSPARLR